MLARGPRWRQSAGTQQSNATHEATFSIIEIVQAVEEMHAVSSIRSLKATLIRFSRNVGLAGGDALFVSADRSSRVGAGIPRAPSAESFAARVWIGLNDDR